MIFMPIPKYKTKLRPGARKRRQKTNKQSRENLLLLKKLAEREHLLKSR